MKNSTQEALAMYEAQDLDPQGCVQLIVELIRTDVIRKTPRDLQRYADELITSGVIDEQGNIDALALEEYLETNY